KIFMVILLSHIKSQFNLFSGGAKCKSFIFLIDQQNVWSLLATELQVVAIFSISKKQILIMKNKKIIKLPFIDHAMNSLNQSELISFVAFNEANEDNKRTLYIKIHANQKEMVVQAQDGKQTLEREQLFKKLLEALAC
ncbi:hypothetical protein, partial [Mycoplasmoides pneumoniae]|uniref:hypothetical protein n=1 Tax=Mycoplasmoides pneumoniae TaxID=2104 RepID=UPI001F27CE12